MKLRISGPARRDIASALAWSDRTFGVEARDRYQDLISRALASIASGTTLAAMHRPDLGEGLHLYHLRHARGDPATVRVPRHFLAYRINGDTAVILRLLRDAMDLPSQMTDE